MTSAPQDHTAERPVEAAGAGAGATEGAIPEANPAADAEATPDTGPVQSVLRRLDTLTDRKTLHLGDIIAAFGETAFLPLLIVLALIVVSPLSGVPLLPTLFGSAIALVSLQLLLRRTRLWLPGWLMRRTISGARLHNALDRLHRIADWIDRAARDRLRLLVTPPFDNVPKAGCLVSGAAMPFLELVPFSSSLLGGAVILFATGLLTRDGLFTVAATGLMLIAALVPLTIYGGLIRAALAGG